MNYGDNGQFRVRRVIGGSETDILNMDSNYPVAGGFHTFDVDFSSVGNISIFVDDVFISSVVDTTYSSSTGVMLGANYDGQTALLADNFKETIFLSSSTYEAEIFNAVQVSTWSTFNATIETNGLDLTFSVRLATFSAGLALESYTTITPGSIINGTPSQIFIQWRAQTESRVLNSVEIFDVTLNFNQGGGSTQRLFAERFKNRLWISVSTGNATADNLVLVKSKSPSTAWIPYSMQIGPMTRFNDFLYAGASTHSAIYRMDFGQNDNGRRIEPRWETRDESWGFPTTSKRLLELVLDFERQNASTFKIGFSRDNGVTYTEKTVNMSGTGRTTKRLFINGGNSIQFRFRFTDTTKDETFQIFGLEAYSRPYRLREN